METIPSASTCMKIEGGYKDAQDDQLRMIVRKQQQGMNFPCPLPTCILTFSTEEEMTTHIKSDNHCSGEYQESDVTIDDRVKRNWIKGLSGKLEGRKTGMSYTKYIVLHLDDRDQGKDEQ